jgi:hypothetical protein
MPAAKLLALGRYPCFMYTDLANDVTYIHLMWLFLGRRDMIPIKGHVHPTKQRIRGFEATRQGDPEY